MFNSSSIVSELTITCTHLAFDRMFKTKKNTKKRRSFHDNYTWSVSGWSSSSSSSRNIYLLLFFCLILIARLQNGHRKTGRQTSSDLHSLKDYITNHFENRRSLVFKSERKTMLMAVGYSSSSIEQALLHDVSGNYLLFFSHHSNHLQLRNYSWHI